MKFLMVALGGGLGAILRYSLDFLSFFNGVFPWKTLFINVLGSFVLGLLYAVARQKQLPAEIVLFAGTGLCGGFTTFSTFAVQSEKLFSTNLLFAFLYIISSLALGIGAVIFAESLMH